MMELPGVPAPTGLLWAAAAGAAALVLIVLLCRRLPKKARRAVFAHCLAAALGAFGLALALGESPASPPDAGTVTTETAPSQPETAPAPSETEPSLPETSPPPATTPNLSGWRTTSPASGWSWPTPPRITSPAR